VSCQATRIPHATGTRAGVRFACWHAPIEALQNGTIVANPRRRRGAGGASSRCVGWHSSIRSLCWLRLGIAVRRPRIRSWLQGSRTLRRGSTAARERSGSCNHFAMKKPLSNSSNTQGKHSIVRFLSSPLKNPGFPRVFRILGQLLWLSCLSMHVHACRCCVVLCAALAPGESSSESPESSPNPRFYRENNAVL
jgi:hypothetical protein